MPIHSIKLSGPPTQAPTTINEHYCDLLTGEFYLAKGISSAADWVKLRDEDQTVDVADITGLGNSAILDVGTTAGTVAAGNHTHTNATQSVAGFMSPTDKARLDAMGSGYQRQIIDFDIVLEDGDSLLRGITRITTGSIRIKTGALLRII